MMQYGMNYTGGGAAPGVGGWMELRCVEAGRGGFGGGDAIRALALDPLKELVWAGTASGMVHAHLAGDLSRVISVFAGAGAGDADDIRGLAVSATSVLAAVPRGLCVLSRGGAPQGSVYADTIADPRALALNPLSDGMVCIGGTSRMLAVVDCNRARILRQAALRGASGVTVADWVATPGLASMAVFATQTGRISLCDPSTMREMQAVAAFAGSVTSISCNGFYMAATGCTTHGGVAYMEQSIKVFDMRQFNSPLPSVPFAAGPLMTAFDPWATANFCGPGGDALWGLSADGVLQCFDASRVPATPISAELHLDSAQDSFTCMAVSSQGLLLFGDSGGFLHEWSATEAAQVNAQPEPVFLSPVTKTPPRPSVNLDPLLTMDAGITIPRISSYITSENGSPARCLTDVIFKHLDRPQSSKPTKSRGRGFPRRPGGHQERLQPQSRYEVAFSRRPWAHFPYRVSQTVLQSAKYQSFVGYATAPQGFVRNSIHGHEPFPVVVSSAKDLPAADGKGNTLASHISPQKSGVRPTFFTEHVQGVAGKGRSFADNGDKTETESLDTDKSALQLFLPSVRSKYVEMDLVAYESVEGFDFLRYNRSGLFCGLENALSNVYVNCVVQALYFTPPLRHAMLRHSCDRESCITCELGFLFHMIDLGGAGMACEAGNFTKAFSTMANADALGLLDGKTALPPSQRIEDFTRYLLEQLHKDDVRQAEDTTVSALFGGNIVSSGRFMTSGIDFSRESRPFQHTLAYTVGSRTADSFCELLANSLVKKMEPTRAYCEASSAFEMMSQKRILKSLPNALLLGCGTRNSQCAKWWCADQQLGAGVEEIAIESMRSLASEDTREEIAQTAMARRGRLLESIGVEIGVDDVNVFEIDNGAEDNIYGYDSSAEKGDGLVGETDGAGTGPYRADYDLSFVVAYVPPTEEEASSASGASGTAGNVHGHLIAYIRVPENYRVKGEANGAGDVSEGKCKVDAKWWCFNDFVIAPCDGFQEVKAFDTRWKVPCLLGYVRRDIRKRMRVPGKNEKDTTLDVREVIGMGNENGAIGLGEQEETPTRGTLFALDCEFVLTGRDEAEIWGDGTRRVVKPAKMALGRVSVIRASGDRKGYALLDDYIHVNEPIVDYLTRFSGLTEGDLDRNRSRYKVRSLKSVYKRLRCLVDAGCVFIGHGLKKDFRIINFVVPAHQVIDTVTLFHLPKRRLLGLRFLTMTLLRSNIQAHTHDSVEDADAAMRLYDLYVRVHGDGSDPERVEQFQKLLQALYSYGYRYQWKADPNNPFVLEY